MADNLDNNITNGMDEYGIQGIQGAQGIQGIQGMRGAQGIQGIQGMDGMQGMQGIQGRKGAAGEKGLVGTQGFPGIQGNVGFQGEKGTRGATGAMGENGADGFQGPKGEKGAAGAQGARGETGVQGEKGSDGFQGPKGEKGATGPQGARGEEGEQGAAGTNGVQGPQGARGKTGPQGARGCEGAQGAKGTKGVDGPQGERGDNGVQGVRGCDGAQGAKGSRGATGPQGERGETGIQGSRGRVGAIGAQGERGMKGAQGARGEYGYQGDDGEVGIQGLTGEDGAIWDDGIRLNGYNTHLFAYNIQSGKFKPVVDDVSPDGQHNYLYIRNGASIKIWLDRNAYNLISENGEILIDTVVGGEYVETNYKAYYANNVSIVGKINPDKDLNGVIEFTFRNGGWYYSGGLLSSGGGGGAGDIFGGKDITVRGTSDESWIDTSLDSAIESSVSIGNIKAGDTIPAGSSLGEILEKIFVKEFQAATEVPTSVITVSPLNDTYSVGDVLGTLNVGHVYTDGKFKPSEGYPLAKFVEYNGATKINAGCTENGTVYEYDGNEIDVFGGEYTDAEPLAEGEHVFSCQTEYGRSTVVAKTNLNNDSTAKINVGATSVSSRRFNVWYNVYVKESIANLPSDFTVLMTSGNRHWITSNDVLHDVEYTIQPLCNMVIIIPTAKDFAISNSLGSPATSEFKVNFGGVVVDGNGVEYNVYYKTNLSAMESMYKWLDFSNA